MIARIRKATEEKDKGFTLVELLVVIAILGILTAIAVPTFLGQRTKAYDSAAKSDVANIGREVATYFVDNDAAPTALVINEVSGSNGTWSLTTSATDQPKGSISNGVGSAGTGAAGFKYTAASGTTAATWCVAVKSKSGSIFKYTQSGPGTGSCA